MDVVTVTIGIRSEYNMKSTIQKILRLFRCKAACSKCKNFIPARYFTQPCEDGCALHNSIATHAKNYKRDVNTPYPAKEWWTPLDELNIDGKCTAYKRRR